jgi:nickel-dependent lactate racemase
MQEITIPYGKSSLTFSVPDSVQIDRVEPVPVPAASEPLALVKQALHQPVGNVRLADFKGAQTAAIAINDKTRPVPNDVLLPPLLEQLASIGVKDTTLIIATGTHPMMPPEQYGMILPQEIISRYRIICHDAEDSDMLVYLGTTPRGTPVWMNRHFLEADLHLVVGNIEPHQFMGFSGGVKSAAIGLAGKETINRNHSMMTHQGARLGTFEANPARQDVEDIGQMIRVDFAVNALLNDKKQLVDAIAGEPKAVMQEGIPRVRSIFQVPVAQLYDVVIVSPGGHPKDINLYQAQKGFAHARLITRDGGMIILAAACPEGTGSQSYEHWVTHNGLRSHEDVIERFSAEGFRVGPHKAFQLSRDASQVNLLLVTEMAPEFVRRLLLEPCADLQETVDRVIATSPPDVRIAVMPAANATIPVLNPHSA